MKLDDRVVGGVLIAFGALVFWRAQSFPLMAGLPYGPGLFPSIAAAGMMACGAVIAVSGRRAGAQTMRSETSQSSEPAQAEPSPARDWRRAARPVGVLALVAAVALVLDPLGFHVTAALAVTGTAIIFGRGPVGAAALGVIAAVAAHAVFYSVLRVPLPWGVMEPVAW